MSLRTLIAAAGLVAITAAGCGPKMITVTDGITMAEGAPPGPNSGIIKTEFGAVVVDAAPGAKAGADLRESAVKRTGFQVYYLIMTSHHAEHTLGNEVFQRAEILATAAARAAMIEKFETERDLLAEKLRLPGLKSAELLPPTMTFEKSMTLYAGWPEEKMREIRMLEMPAGAGPGNLVVYLPKEKVLFTGNLVTNGVFPYMGDADIGEWIKALDELEKLDVEHVVPGHGKAGGRELIAATRQLLADLCAVVNKAKAESADREQIAKTFTLPGYEKWPGCRELLPVALERLWDQDLPEVEIPAAPLPGPGT